MEDLGTLLAGGRHAAYVWWCYGIAAACLGALALQSLAWRRRLRRELAALETTRGPAEDAT